MSMVQPWEIVGEHVEIPGENREEEELHEVNMNEEDDNDGDDEDENMGSDDDDHAIFK